MHALFVERLRKRGVAADLAHSPLWVAQALSSPLPLDPPPTPIDALRSRLEAFYLENKDALRNAISPSDRAVLSSPSSARDVFVLVAALTFLGEEATYETFRRFHSQ